jgi:hypothetical protein
MHRHIERGNHSPNDPSDDSESGTFSFNPEEHINDEIARCVVKADDKATLAALRNLKEGADEAGEPWILHLDRGTIALKGEQVRQLTGGGTTVG